MLSLIFSGIKHTQGRDIFEARPMMQSEADFLLTSYDYELPEERIAQYPPEVRGTSRLFVLDRASGKNIHTDFAHLPEFLPKDALLVVNNTRVVPARLFGQKPSGGKCELLVLTPPPLLKSCARIDGEWAHAPCECLLRPGRSIRVGTGRPLVTVLPPKFW
jgi:S-adenosylmethionine:tRNA ribosyltransferase-isomerase